MVPITEAIPMPLLEVSKEDQILGVNPARFSAVSTSHKEPVRHVQNSNFKALHPVIRITKHCAPA